MRPYYASPQISVPHLIGNRYLGTYKFHRLFFPVPCTAFFDRRAEVNKTYDANNCRIILAKAFCVKRVATC